MTGHLTTPIDVLLPVFNGEPWLAAAVDSILRQTHTALTLHAVDDGSTDATPAILAAAARSDPRVRVHGKANGGIVSALNHGLLFCSAEFVARHDADDLAHPQRLATQLRYLRTHADCVAVGAVARHIDARGQPLGTLTELRPPELADPNWLPAREPYLMHPLLMVRRAALVQAGAYRHVSFAEDSDLYWRLRGLGRLHNLPEVLADYRLHGGSLSSRSLHNGRVMAVASQLAAASARHRQAGAEDLVFDVARAQRLCAVQPLHAMVAGAAADLAPGERPAFALAVAAKLMELAAYQPFEPDAADCAFIGAALRSSEYGQAAFANRRALAGQATRAALRLCKAGRDTDAWRLMPRGMLPRFAWRWAVRGVLPSGLRRQLHGLLRRRAPSVP